MIDQRIDASTLRFAVLGESLPHTWSPQIHNTLFSAAGIQAVYLPITVPRSQLSSAVDVLRSCFCGFNVTIPYKERIIPYLDEIDETAQVCGAVNTVENRNGKLIGHITDGIGMLRAIEEGGIATNSIRVLILGGGGAARVAAYELLQRQCRITIAVRNPDKGQKLSMELSATQPDGIARISVCSLSDIHGSYDLLINCTPVGMYPDIYARPVSIDVISHCGAVFDAVYNPRTTELLDVASTLHIPAIEGLGMLYYQAVEAQRLWLGSEQLVPEYTQQQIYLELLAQMQ